MAIVSKSEFARRRNVTPGRVTQWISQGKIKPDALVGEGRSAQIDEAIAIEQLRRNLDIDQRHSMNGLDTNLVLDLPPAASRAGVEQEAGPAIAPAPLPSSGSVENKIALARLEGLERSNRRAQIEEAEQLGRLVDADQARAAAAREIRQVIARFEGSLSDLANSMAAEFKLEPRAVLHLLRGRFREIRRSGAIEARERAAPMVDQVGYELGDQ